MAAFITIATIILFVIFELSKGNISYPSIDIMNTIKLTGVPTVCIDLDTKELFLETLDEINTVARTAKQEKEEKFIATVACKAAVKAHMALTREEVDSLMDKLLELPNPFTCPHGRPTAIKMTQYDIEKKFARKL